MQVSVPREAEVSGSQERTLSAEKACAEDACGLRRISPVTRTGGGPVDPDLSHRIGRAQPARLGIDDEDVVLGRRRSAGWHRIRVIGSGRRSQSVLPQRFQRHGRGGLPDPHGAATHQQRGLGQSVERTDRLASQSVTRKTIGKAVQGLHPDRLGTAAGDRPATEIEAGAVRVVDLMKAEIVGEVRRDTNRAAVLRDRFEPAHRPRDERGGRHENRGDSGKERRADPAKQAEVVKMRDPANPDRLLRQRRLGCKQPGIACGVVVRHHHPARIASRTRRVLQNARRVAQRHHDIAGLGIDHRDVGRERLKRAAQFRQDVSKARRQMR